jgi:hypothetical protein
MQPAAVQLDGAKAGESLKGSLTPGARPISKGAKLQALAWHEMQVPLLPHW